MTPATRLAARWGALALCAGLATCGTGPPVEPADPVPARLVLTASDTITVTGGRLAFAAQAVDSLGAPVTAGPIRWTVSNTGRGAVDAAGVFTGGPLVGSVYVRAWLEEPSLAESVVAQVVPPGTVKWRWAAADVGGHLPHVGGVALGLNGTVYALVTLPAFYSSKLVAIDERGLIRWSVQLGSVGSTYPMVTPGGEILVVGQRIYLVHPNGTILREILTDAYLPSLQAGAVTSDVLVAAIGERIMAWQLATGDGVWQSPYLTLGPWLVPPTIVGTSRVFAKQSDDSLFVFDLADGAVQRAFPDPDTGVDKRVFGTGPVVVDGRVYLPTFGRLAAFDTAGPLLWLTDEIGRGETEPAVSGDGQLYVQNGRWGLEAIGPAGATTWYRRRYLATGRLAEEPRWNWYGGPAVAADGIVYGAGWDRFFAYDAEGTLLWEYQADSAGVAQAFEGSPAIGPDGIVYTFTDTHVYAFWASSPPDPGSPWPMWRHDAQRTGWVR